MRVSGRHTGAEKKEENMRLKRYFPSFIFFSTVHLFVQMYYYSRPPQKIVRGAVFVCPMKHRNVLNYIRRKSSSNNFNNNVKVVTSSTTSSTEKNYGANFDDNFGGKNISRSFCISKPECYFAKSGVYDYLGKYLTFIIFDNQYHSHM